MVDISTVVLTKNEEKNIERCLKSVIGISREIVVVDSGSEDRTVELAGKYTDRIFFNPWPGFSAQRTFALTKTSCDWVLWIDADEELSEKLAGEIASLDFSRDGYHIPRLVHYLGKWIRHCGWYPDYTLRLFDKNKGSFNGAIVHEAFNIEGTTGKLRNPIFHYPYRTIAHHLEKINLYTDLAAEQMQEKGKKASVSSALFHSFFKFIKMYLIKAGFLDGRQGIVVSVLGSYYVFLKYVKLYEKQGLPDRTEPDLLP
jgi:glycosyltransferase involved in cell wall biosynthesis